MLDLHREWFKGLEIKTAKIFAVFPFTPNQYTASTIFFILICDYLLVSGNYWFALPFFVFSSIMDFVDGAVARATKITSPKGAYWDTIADRYVEAIFLFGLLFVGLPGFYLSSSAWIFLALVGSMMTTYAKAAAKEKEIISSELKGGLMSRGERFALYFIILIIINYNLQFAIYLLALSAVLSNLTALQRIQKTLGK